ncbi:MAG: hypothetical protein ACI8QZ_002004 [Chlamydiales bacterium]|jgi:hypothetical protein
MKITNPALVSLALAMTLSMSSCAAMLTGTTGSVQFDSNPRGATVLAGDQEGVTPCLLKLPKSTKEFTIQHENHGEQVLTLERTFQGGMVAMDILFTPGFGLSGMLIDGATGAFYKLPPSAYHDFTLPVTTEGDDEATVTQEASAPATPEA